MANCAGIFQGQSFDCADPLSVGIVQRLFVANLDDVETITFSGGVGEENIVTGITMKSTKAFFEFENINESLSANEELVRSSFANSFRHIIDFSVFEVDNTTRKNLEAMAYKKIIAIWFQADDSSFGNGAFNVAGFNSGLELATLTRAAADTETGGAYRAQLATPESGGSEPTLPAVFWDTDYATTLAAVEALKTPAA